jgi:predicted enzyme related to lactoylglutathione lyase
MAIEVLGIDNILFAVGNFAEAHAFYESQLGLPVKFVLAEAGIIAYRLGTEELGLFLRVQNIAPMSPRDTPRVWLEVADARTTAQILAASGAALLREPWEVGTGWVIEIADPWGNVIGLTDYVKEPSKGRSIIDSNATGNER